MFEVHVRFLKSDHIYSVTFTIKGLNTSVQAEEHVKSLLAVMGYRDGEDQYTIEVLN